MSPDIKIIELYAHNTKAEVLVAAGELEKAVAEYESAEKLIKEGVYDPAYNRFAVAMLKAGTLSKMARYEESETVCREQEEYVKSVYGEQSTNYATLLYYLANTEAFCGEFDKASDDYLASLEILQNEIRNQIRFVTFSGKAGYWNSLSKELWAVTPFFLKAKIEGRKLEKAYEALLFAKSFLLESDISASEILYRYGSSEDRKLYLQYLSSKARLKSSPDADGRLTVECNTLNLRLADRLKSLGIESDYLNISFDDIRNALKPGEVLVDVTNYRKNDGTDQYAAYIVKPGEETLELIELFKREQLDSILNGRALTTIYDGPKAGLFTELLWGEIGRHIGNAGTIYYAPSGVLQQVSLGSLKNETGGCLSDRLVISRLTSAKELLRLNRTLSHASASVFGGLDYDLDTETMAEESSGYDLPEIFTMRGKTSSGNTAFEPLSQSKQELISVEKSLKSAGVNVNVYSGRKGTEEAFLSIDGSSPNILLLSTHGFYYTPDSAQEVEYLKGYRDAMALSGLVMSGANHAWLGETLPDGVLGGILSANKISRMDLRGNDLAVLASCGSGNGEVTPEGVFGLQRAFKKAGTQTLLMTLWDVSDVVSRYFVETFFKQLSTNGWDKYKAFAVAKETVRKRYEEPYFWAGFEILD